jgi:hypothetical protein
LKVLLHFCSVWEDSERFALWRPPQRDSLSGGRLRRPDIFSLDDEKLDPRLAFQLSISVKGDFRFWTTTIEGPSLPRACRIRYRMWSDFDHFWETHPRGAFQLRFNREAPS